MESLILSGNKLKGQAVGVVAVGCFVFLLRSGSVGKPALSSVMNLLGAFFFFVENQSAPSGEDGAVLTFHRGESVVSLCSVHCARSRDELDSSRAYMIEISLLPFSHLLLFKK